MIFTFFTCIIAYLTGIIAYLTGIINPEVSVKASSIQTTFEPIILSISH